MRLSFDDGTLLLEDASETVPYAEWDDRVNEYRAQAHHYREIQAWADGSDGQATLQQSAATVTEFEDAARAERRGAREACKPSTDDPRR